MARYWDPNAKKWVNKPEGTKGLVDPRFRSAQVNAPVVVPKYPAAAAGEEAYNQMFGDTAGAGFDWESLWGVGGGGGASKPSDATMAQRGYQASRQLGQAGRQAQGLYQQRAGEQAAAMQGMYEPAFAQQEAMLRGLPEQAMAAYNPYFSQAESSIEAQRKAAMEALLQQYTGNVGTINTATEQALAGIPAAQAYSDVPIVQLATQANPLLDSIQGFGASGEASQAQSAQDALLAGQLAQMARSSASQLNQAQQAMQAAARGDVGISQSRALQQLALQRMAGEGAIGSQAQGLLSDLAAERARLGSQFAVDQQRGLADLARERAGANVGVEEVRQGLLNQGLEALIGGLTGAATQRAQTAAQYGPPKTKSKPKPKQKQSKGKK